MASAGDAVDEEAAAGAETMAKRKKRISDCLRDSDGPDDAPPSPATPRLRIPMFTCARLRFGGRKAGGRQKHAAAIAAEKSEEGASVDSSAGWKAASSSGASSAEAAAGMGLGLLFLLAKTCAELKKMAEVRAQMEALLEDMRAQLAAARTTKNITTGSSSNNNPHAAATGSARAVAAASSSPPNPGRRRRRRRHSRRRDDQGRERRGEPPPPPSSSFYAMTGNPLFDGLDRDLVLCDSSSAMETASGESESGATTAEVESPAASTMAVDVIQQFQPNRATNQETSEWSSSDGEFIELDGGFLGGGRRGDYSSEEYYCRAESSGEERAGGGVSALEVERRLQGILHRRSQERIEELESSLRRAGRKLVEKEMEARLWKDTAKLALQPPRQRGKGADGAVGSAEPR